MPPAETIVSLLVEGRERLAGAAFEILPREAALLLGRVTGLSEAQLIARSEDPVEPGIADRFRDLLERRLSGEPVAYLFGEREFYGRVFAVDDRVLIPRPETEHLIEAALELELPDAPRILDLGTGSGCIAITLALEIPGARVVATDVSPGALAVAAANARRLGASVHVAPAAGDLASALRLDTFDLVLSNPPYVDPAVRGELSTEVTGFEPDGALFGGSHGTAVLERLFDGFGRLRPGTPMVIEIGYDQADALADLAAAGGHCLIGIRPDLAGRPRVAVLRAGRRRATGR